MCTVVVSMFLLPLLPIPPSRASAPVIRCYRVLKRPCALNFDSMGNGPTKVTRSWGVRGRNQLFVPNVVLGSLFQGVSVFGDFIAGDDAEMVVDDCRWRILMAP